MTATKESLRKQYLGNRKALSATEWAVLNEKIAHRVLKIIEERKPLIVHSFLPKLSANEVNTQAILERLRKLPESPRIIVPKVTPGRRELKHFHLTPATKLQTNRLGIAEPAPGTAVEANELQPDLVLVPLLVFDEEGHRLGYGGGYYDRFLARIRPDAFTLGLSFFPPIESIPGIEPTDVALNAVITPEKTWKFGHEKRIS